MLTTQGETSEKDILARIAATRAEPEPDKPTEPVEAVDVSEEAPVEEAAVATEETEEEVATEETVATDDDEEELYVEIKGREINLKDIEEWEQGNLRQSDYTRKTTELAEQRKTFETEKTDYNERQGQLDANIAALEAIISEETLTPEALAEMREYEPEQYIKHQERADKLQKAVANSKQSQPVSTVDVAAERDKLWNANPSWVDNGKQTKAFDADMALISAYATPDNGYTGEEVAGIQQAHHWQTILDAAKWRKSQESNAAIEKKVRKAPVTTKPKAAQVSSIQAKIKDAQAKLKQTGRMEDAQTLRKLKRQLNT